MNLLRSAKPLSAADVRRLLPHRADETDEQLEAFARQAFELWRVLNEQQADRAQARRSA